MKTAVLVVLLLSALAVSGENMITNVPAQTVQKLREAGFAVAFSTSAAKQTAVSPEVQVSAERRLLDVGVSNLFAAGDKSPVLAVCPSTSDHPDAFAVNAESGGDKITALVSEFQTDFSVIPAKPSRQDSQTARSEFRSWSARLLNPAWQAQGNDQSIEVLDEGDYFLVRKVSYDERGGRRFIPWTRSESLKMVLDKNGHWLILSVADLPEKVSLMPAGGRGRSTGSWFTSPSSRKDVVKKKATE
jgi:hypothetical protein